MIPIRRRTAIGLIAAACGLAACAKTQKPVVGGPFHMVDQDGKQVDESILKGKWSLVFFGYTFCPDVCPTTLQTVAQAEDRLGPKAKKLQVVFVTIDPARDTPRQLKTYLASPAFPKGTIGLTGTAAQVDAAAKAYKVFYQKQGTGPDYAMDHSSAVYLMDPKGRFDRVVAYGLSPDEIAHQVSEAMRG
jgi:protein SCO1/2